MVCHSSAAHHQTPSAPNPPVGNATKSSSFSLLGAGGVTTAVSPPLQIAHTPPVERPPPKVICTVQLVPDTPQLCRRTIVTKPFLYVPYASVTSPVGRYLITSKVHLTYCAVTAGSDQYLCSLPISKLKAYAKAYNLPFPGGIEKKDLVEKLISCRNNGCLPAENEVRSTGSQATNPSLETIFGRITTGTG